MWRLTRLAHRVAPELPSSTPTRLPKPIILAIGQLQVHTGCTATTLQSVVLPTHNKMPQETGKYHYAPPLPARPLLCTSACRAAHPTRPMASKSPSGGPSLVPPLHVARTDARSTRSPGPQPPRISARGPRQSTKPVTQLPHQPAPCMPQPCPPYQPEPEIAPASFAARSLSAAFAAATQLETTQQHSAATQPRALRPSLS